MTAPVFTAADFTAALQALMPRGLAWPRDPDATQTAVLAALAQVYERTNARANALLVDAFPATSVELLPEWIAALGVPGPLGTLATTVAGRQNQVVQALVGDGGSSVAYFIALCAGLGVTVTITQYRPWNFGMPINLPIAGDNWAHSWLVTGAAGNAPLQALITQYAPAHTVVAFN